MKPTYDFSTPRSAPPPPAPPLKVRRRPSKQLLIVIAVVVLVAVAGALAYARFSSSDQVKPADPRFCAASSRLTQALATAGAQPVGVVPAAVRPEAVASALQQAGGSVGDLESFAPSKIKSDVKLVVADLRAAAGGDMAAVRTPRFASAEQRIADFLHTPAGCPGGEAGPGVGDG